MDIYGLAHQRYILTDEGLNAMKEKFDKKVFGVCPRTNCNRCPVLPVGISEDLSVSRVKVFCPKCQEVYVPRMKQVDIDGAYFGCTFPHVFIKTFQNQVQNLVQDFCPYIPRIYGFKISHKKGSVETESKEDLIKKIYSDIINHK